MKTSHLTILVLAIILTGVAVIFFKSKPAETTSQPAMQAQAQQVTQQPVTGIATGKDTIVMIFNKQSAQQILGALQNQYPTTQNAPQLTVGQFLATQQVFSYMEAMIVKKWADLNPKSAVQPAPVKK